LELSERITLAGGDPLEVIDLFVATLRVLADGLEEPNLDWVNSPARTGCGVLGAGGALGD
jgi:hypothetical protein